MNKRVLKCIALALTVCFVCQILPLSALAQAAGRGIEFFAASPLLAERGFRVTGPFPVTPGFSPQD